MEDRTNLAYMTEVVHKIVGALDDYPLSFQQATDNPRRWTILFSPSEPPGAGMPTASAWVICSVIFMQHSLIVIDSEEIGSHSYDNLSYTLMSITTRLRLIIEKRKKSDSMLTSVSELVPDDQL